MNYPNYPSSSANALLNPLPSLSPNDAARLPLASLQKKPKGPSACDACRKKKVRCDKQHPCSTCTTRGIPCKYELVEAAAAAASMPSSLRCLPPAPRYIFAPDDSLKYMPPISFPNSSAAPHSSFNKPRRSINTAFQESPFARQCTSDSVAAARLSNPAYNGVDFPPLPPLSSQRLAGYSSNSSLRPLPALDSSINRTSSNPILQPNLRSGSWSQVESALPPLTSSLDSYAQPYTSLARDSSYHNLNSTGPMSSIEELDFPPMPSISRSGSPNLGLKRSASTNSLSSLSDWNSLSKTPSLSLDGSRRSASSDIDDQFSMPSTAGSFGLQTPLHASSTLSGISRSQKPMFGYDAPSAHASPYSVHAPTRNTSLDPLHGLDSSSALRPSNSFRNLSTETYPSLTPYTPGYSSGNGALASLPLLPGTSDMYGLDGTSSHLGGFASTSSRRGGLPSMPSYGSTMPNGFGSPASSDPLGRNRDRRLSRTVSYAGLSSFEASGW